MYAVQVNIAEADVEFTYLILGAECCRFPHLSPLHFGGMLLSNAHGDEQKLHFIKTIYSTSYDFN